MNALARIKKGIFCVELACVEKLAKENTGVKRLLVKKDMFDRTVDAKGMKTKDSKEAVPAILTMVTKKNRPMKIWVAKGKTLPESSKHFAHLNENNFILQGVGLRLHLLNVRYDP